MRERSQPYHREHGNLDVPVGYTDENGIRLGAWLAKLRSMRRSKAAGAELSEEQTAKLDALGMVWEKRGNVAWDTAFAEAKEYYEQNGDLDVPATYKTNTGFALGRWIYRQREQGETIDETRKMRLSEIEMLWEKSDPWEEKIRLVEAYYAEHGDVNIPADYVVDGVWLARWLSEQVARFNGKPTGRNKTVKPLTKEQCARIEALGIKKNVSRNDLVWEEQYLEAKAYYEENGDLAISKRYVSPGGKNLGVWEQRQRLLRRDGKLKAEQIAKLDAIGMAWETKERKTGTRKVPIYAIKNPTGGLQTQ